MDPMWRAVLIVFMCAGEFGKGFRLPQPYNIKEVANDKPASRHPETETIYGYATRNNTSQVLSNNENETLVFVPLIREELLAGPTDFYPIVPPPYPVYYGSNADDLRPLESFGDYQAALYREDPYIQYYPPYQSLPQPDHYSADIRYFPAANEMPILSAIINPGPITSELEDNILRKIFKIVRDLETKNNSIDSSGLEPSREGSNSATEQSNMNTIPYSKYNTTEAEKDRLRIEIPINLNQTETAEVKKLEAESTVSPTRFVVEQFFDQNGNPCSKEVVFSDKKTYYVYTCEERSVPKKMAYDLNSTQNINEFTTTLDTPEIPSEEKATSPMNEVTKVHK